MPLVRTALALACLGLFALPALAQDKADGALSIELNTAETRDGTCTLTFVVRNEHAGPIDKLVFETVLFDTAGAVNRLTLFDFGALPVGLPRVRQFALPQTPCDGLGRVLFNGLNTCDGLDAKACTTGFQTSTRTGIEVLG